MAFKKGDRVRHPSKQEWGLGEVLEDSKVDSVRVFFVVAGEKQLSFKYVQPQLVTGEESSHPALDNLKISKTSSSIKYQSLSESINYFLEHFPEGFEGKKFHDQERDYKVKAHELGVALLSKYNFKKLLSVQDYEEICKRAFRLVNATNLIFPNEKMSLKDGVKDHEAQKLFSETLNNYLYGQSKLEERFNAFAKVLGNIGADKWTIASYYLFIIHPDSYMFVKPSITQHSAELCGFEINYKPQLNWTTYKLVLEFSEYLRQELVGLHPRDMIDVQSFMWCIAPGKY